MSYVPDRFYVNLSSKNAQNNREGFQEVALDSKSAYMFPEIIHTVRLILRPYKGKDLDDIMLYATDPRWAKFLPVPQPYERNHGADFINSQLALDRSMLPSWAIEFEGKVIGGLNLRFFSKRF